MKNRFRCGLVVCWCCLALLCPSAWAAQVPANVEGALGELLKATTPGTAPTEEAMQTVLAYVADTSPTPETDLPSSDNGTGGFYSSSFKVPLKTMLSYILDPAIPGDTLYPSSVRSNYWYPESELITNSYALREATFPPAKPLVTRGVEYEETTPDESSGCYYVYRLNRLFVLTAYKGRTVLFSVSSMPKESSVGRKGLIVEPDSDWLYVYTPTVGTNLSMLGWAETFLYGSASVTVFIESAPGAATTNMFSFKWVKAGWSGMNVVKLDHVIDGLKRYVTGFKTVLESPKRPTPEAIKAHLNQLKGLDDTALRALLAPLAALLNAKEADVKILREKSFQEVIKDGAYPASLNRNQLINELMKLFVREQLGLTVPQKG